MNSYKREKENLHKETLKVWCKSLVCSLRAINHDLYLLCFKKKCRGSTNKSDEKNGNLDSGTHKYIVNIDAL